MKWSDIGQENLEVAKLLLLKGRWRSAVNRAYYAAYASLAGALDGRAQYPDGRFGPSHDRLPLLVMTYLTELRFYERAKIASTVRRIYRQRITADYEPPGRVERDEARVAVQDALSILRSIADVKN